jgi:hypothetical protein
LRSALEAVTIERDDYKSQLDEALTLLAEHGIQISGEPQAKKSKH